jgi:uncharacterized protein (TIGR02996 family)
MASDRAASDRLAFLRAICDDPADDSPRLVFADWLDEHGEPERAEFIRLQCELAGRPDRPGRWQELRDRQDELLRRHGPRWRAELPSWLRAVGVFRRGFVDSLACTADAFLARAGDLETLPVQKLHLWNAGSRLGPLLVSPLLARVDTLSLSGNALGDAAAAGLAECPYLHRLTWLDLGYNQVGDLGAAALAASACLGSLAELYLNNNHVGEAGATALVESRRLRLRRLLLLSNPLTDAGRQRLRVRAGAVVVV